MVSMRYAKPDILRALRLTKPRDATNEFHYIFTMYIISYRHPQRMVGVVACEETQPGSRIQLSANSVQVDR